MKGVGNGLYSIMNFNKHTTIITIMHMGFLLVQVKRPIFVSIECMSWVPPIT